jgi:tetratricopeptide (TPR) repeat protein
VSLPRLEVGRCSSLALAAALLVSGLPASVSGQSPVGAELDTEAPSAAETVAPENKQRAKVLAQEGREQFWAGEYAAAIDAFTQAHELVADPNLLYNISAALEKLGRYDDALAYLDQYAPHAPASESAALETKRRELEEAKQRAEPTGTAAIPPPEPDPVTPPPDEPPTETPPRLMGPLGWTFVGVGAVGLGLGLGFGFSARAASTRGESACSDVAGSLRCPESAKSDLDRARRHAIVADVGFGIAILATVATITLVAVRAAKKRNKGRSASLAPRKIRFAPATGRLGAGLRF